MTDHDTHLTRCTVDIVAAYVSRAAVAPTEIPGLLRTVRDGLAALDAPASPTAAPEPEVVKPGPSEIRKSIRPDGIVSFIDGKVRKTLKRHLTNHRLTPERYRERYGLPDDYPMIAPGYAAQRSALAKAIGLGVPGRRAERAAA